MSKLLRGVAAGRDAKRLDTSTSSSNDGRLLAHPFPGTYKGDDRLIVRRFTFGLATFLTVSGIWGFFSPLVLGFLTSNTRRALIETALGLIGLRLALSRVTYEYLMLAGALLLLLGVARYLPGIRDFVISLLNLNTGGAVLYIIAGGIAVLFASTGKPPPR